MSDLPTHLWHLADTFGVARPCLHAVTRETDRFLYVHKVCGGASVETARVDRAQLATGPASVVVIPTARGGRLPAVRVDLHAGEPPPPPRAPAVRPLPPTPPWREGALRAEIRPAFEDETFLKALYEHFFRDVAPWDAGYTLPKYIRAMYGSEAGHAWDDLHNWPKPSLDAEDLRVLGLDAMPTREALRVAWRAVAAKVHPDAGGSDAAFVEARAAFERLEQRLAGVRA